MAPPRTTKGRRNMSETPPPVDAPEQTPNTLDLIDKCFQMLETMISTFISAQVKDSSPTTAPNVTPTPTVGQPGPSSDIPTPPITQLMPPPPHMPMKSKGPKPFKGDEGTLEKFLFQMDEYFHPYKYVGDDDKLATLALYLEGSVLDWWRQKKNNFCYVGRSKASVGRPIWR